MLLPVDRAFVLNLDRRPDRWQTALRRLLRHDIMPQRFSAVDGSAYTFLHAYWNENARKRFVHPGALACLLSHIQLLECAQLNGYKRIAIFEDDVRPHRELGTMSKKLNELSDWHVVYLGATQLKWENVRPGPTGFYRPHTTLGTWAMLVDERAYDRMLAAYRELRCSADLTLSELFAADDDVYVASPNLCICDVSDSDIRKPLIADRFAKECRWSVDDYEP